MLTVILPRIADHDAVLLETVPSLVLTAAVVAVLASMAVLAAVLALVLAAVLAAVLPPSYSPHSQVLSRVFAVMAAVPTPALAAVPAPAAVLIAVATAVPAAVLTAVPTAVLAAAPAPIVVAVLVLPRPQPNLPQLTVLLRLMLPCLPSSDGCRAGTDSDRACQCFADCRADCCRCSK